MPFVIENGEHPTKYRGWNSFGPTWVDSVDDAIQYARRKDAESQHAEDEDGVFIREIEESGELIPHGPFGAMQMAGSPKWAVYRVEGGRIQSLMAFEESFSDSDAELAAVICASALNRVLPNFEAMRKKAADSLDNWTKAWITGKPGEPIGGLLTPDKLLTVPDNIVDVFHLFYEFVTRNACKWQLGAGDHHHPMWEMTAEILNGRPPITEGVDWAFIQPENRLKLAALRAHKNKIELKDGQ